MVFDPQSEQGNHSLTLCRAVLVDGYRNLQLKLDHVTQYSFGQHEDGRPVVWAAGKAGWFEINPSARYLSHYEHDAEAIDLFYFLVDQYEKVPKKRRRHGFEIDSFLGEYQKHTNYRVDDNDEAMEALHKHHKFLLKQMFEQSDGIDWSETQVWKHLAEAYPEEVAQLAGTQIREDGSDEVLSTNSEDLDAESEQDSNNPVTDIRDWTQTIWEVLLSLRISSNISWRHCTIDKLAGLLQQHSEFPGDYEEAVAAIECSAETLLNLMKEAKLRKKFNWTTRPIYAELKATLADKIAEVQTPDKRPDKRHRQKSVLRPSGQGSKANKRSREIEKESPDADAEEPSALSPVPDSPRSRTVPLVVIKEDYGSPSRQLNGEIDALPFLPPPPEAQEMLDLVKREAKAVGRQKQISHLEAFLAGWPVREDDFRL